MEGEDCAKHIIASITLGGHAHVWLPPKLDHCLLMMGQLTEVTRGILMYEELYILLIFSQMRKNWQDSASQYRWIMTKYCKSNPKAPWVPDFRRSLSLKDFTLVKPLQLKLKFFSSITSWWLHWKKSTVVVYRIMKGVLLSKYLWTVIFDLSTFDKWSGKMDTHIPTYPHVHILFTALGS